MFQCTHYKMFSLTICCSLFICFAAGQDFFSVPIKIVNSNDVVVRTYVSSYDTHSKLFQNVLKGLAVLANPPDACKPIAPPPFPYNGTLLRFVLINSTELIDCFPDVKARNAEAAQFDLALIYGNNLWPMIRGFNINRIGIPILHIGQDEGIEIVNYYLYNRSSDMYFLRVYPPTNDISYYIMLFAIVIGVCLLVMLFFIICLLVKCIQARRQTMRNRLSYRQIRQLPTETFKRGDQYDICAICLEQYNEGEKLRILPCSHAYHVGCIDPWLRENRRNCPLCKRKVRFGSDSSDSESESEVTSAGEDTPLINSAQAGNQSWGTFCNDSGHQPESGATAGAPQPEAHDSELDKSVNMPSATGSINSCDGASVEFYSCNLPQDSYTTRGNEHDRLI